MSKHERRYPGRVRRAQRPNRHERHLRAGRYAHSGTRPSFLKKASSAASNRTACSCPSASLRFRTNTKALSKSRANLPVGMPAAQALGLDDPMIYIKVTPNRPDALGVHGIARDLAAKGLGKPQADRRGPDTGKFKSPIGVKLEFER